MLVGSWQYVPKGQEARLPCDIVVCMFIDSIIDGFIIGLLYSIVHFEGIVIASSYVFEFFSIALTLSLQMQKHKVRNCFEIFLLRQPSL